METLAMSEASVKRAGGGGGGRDDEGPAVPLEVGGTFVVLACLYLLPHVSASLLQSKLLPSSTVSCVCDLQRRRQVTSAHT